MRQSKTVINKAGKEQSTRTTFMRKLAEVLTPPDALISSRTISQAKTDKTYQQ
ncbi:hypothetical protein [Kordiimonas aquimaris]|uniref:hypothetical protein n=1 Tax=Kordiimonas aquimaris TaxID=707591 RepID=UPI0021D0BC0D|nr:hypothetical protein [Kordiimonas aquimaris]